MMATNADNARMQATDAIVIAMLAKGASCGLIQISRLMLAAGAFAAVAFAIVAVSI